MPFSVSILDQMEKNTYRCELDMFHLAKIYNISRENNLLKRS